MPNCYIVEENNQNQGRHQFCSYNDPNQIDAYRINYETSIELSQQSNANENSLLTTSVTSSNISSPSSSSPSSPSSSIIDFHPNNIKSGSNSVNPNDYEMVSTWKG